MPTQIEIHNALLNVITAKEIDDDIHGVHTCYSMEARLFWIRRFLTTQRPLRAWDIFPTPPIPAISLYQKSKLAGCLAVIVHQTMGKDAVYRYLDRLKIDAPDVHLEEPLAALNIMCGMRYVHLDTKKLSTKRMKKIRLLWKTMKASPTKKIVSIIRSMRYEGKTQAALQLLSYAENEFPDDTRIAQEKRVQANWESYRCTKSDLGLLINAWEVGTLSPQATRVLHRVRELAWAESESMRLLIKTYQHLIDDDSKRANRKAWHAFHLNPTDPEAALAIVYTSTLSLTNMPHQLGYDAKRKKRAQARKALRFLHVAPEVDPVRAGEAAKRAIRAIQSSLNMSHQLLHPLEVYSINQLIIERLCEQGQWEEAYDLLSDVYLAKEKEKTFPDWGIQPIIELAIRAEEFDFAGDVLRNYGTKLHPHTASTLREQIHKSQEHLNKDRPSRPSVRSSSVLRQIGTRTPANKLASMGTVGDPYSKATKKQMKEKLYSS